MRSTRAARNAGARPKRMPVRIDTANVNASTRPSRPIASSRGIFPGLMPRIAPRVSAATSSPATPPMRPSSADSVRSWRTSRCQPAPSATRTAISFWRAVARVSNRFATFAHAMSSTSVTEPITTNTARRTLPTTDSTSGTTSIVKVRSRLSFSRIRAAIAGDVGVRLLDRHARLQSRHDVVVLVAAAIHRIGAEWERQKHDPSAACSRRSA